MDKAGAWGFCRAGAGVALRGENSDGREGRGPPGPGVSRSD